MVFSATFNNIFQLYRDGQFLLVEETGVSGENHPQVTDKLYHIMLYRTHLACAGFKLTTLVVIGTDYICSFNTNYHTTTTAPLLTHSLLKHFMLLVKINKRHVRF